MKSYFTWVSRILQEADKLTTGYLLSLISYIRHDAVDSQENPNGVIDGTMYQRYTNGLRMR